MTSRTPSEPPDEPLNVAEPQILSPASPKPIHFPTPTNIPVLEMQMDVGFNQTEAHMNDPAMRNTEVRPNLWRDPGEAQVADAQLQQNASTRQSLPPPAIKQEPDNTAATPMSADSAPHNAKPLEPSLYTSNGSISNLLNFTASPSHALPNVQPTVEQTDSFNLAPNVAHDPSVDDNLAKHPPTAYNGAVDVQSLLNTLGHGTSTLHEPTQQSPHALPPIPDAQPSAPGVDDPSLSAQDLGAPPSGLPPRPPPQEQPLINQNYAHSQHIRDYHPHASKPASQHNIPPALSPTSAVDPALSISLPNPLSARLPPAVFPNDSRRDNGAQSAGAGTSEDRPWDSEIQRKYDRFIEEERKYVSEGRWEQFPQGSRLFVGNLSSEKVTKRDVFHVFHRYGELAQISIKQAYGFVQFLRPEDCNRAMLAEQGRQVRDKRLHLEVSKPQKNRPGQQQSARRSRSPDYNRGSKAGGDRYGRNQSNQQQRGYRHDSYGPRSPSPPRGGQRDRRFERYRSRSPPGGYNRGRGYRSPTPPRRSEDDDLPLPRRAPRDVPDVQVLVTDNLDRDFVAWVERAFTGRSVRADVLILSPRLSEQAVVRRQIVEGVVAVSKLTRRNQDMSKIGLQIFDRSGGANNVKFEEYDNLDPNIAVELVLRAKQTQAAPAPVGQYGAPPQTYSGYGGAAPFQQQPASMPAYPQPPSQSTAPPSYQNMIAQMDPKSLQNLLSAMNQPATSTAQQYAPPTPAGLYGNPNASFNGQQQAALSALQQNPQALANLLQQPHQQAAYSAAPSYQAQPQAHMSSTTTTPQSASAAGVNMQEILARLGTYKP